MQRCALAPIPRSDWAYACNSVPFSAVRVKYLQCLWPDCHSITPRVVYPPSPVHSSEMRPEVPIPTTRLAVSFRLFFWEAEKLGYVILEELQSPTLFCLESFLSDRR
jgi:hypothetical protein